MWSRNLWLPSAIITDCPKTDGSGAEITVVVVAAWFTVWVSVPDEPVKFASPP